MREGRRGPERGLIHSIVIQSGCKAKTDVLGWDGAGCGEGGEGGQPNDRIIQRSMREVSRRTHSHKQSDSGWRADRTSIQEKSTPLSRRCPSWTVFFPRNALHRRVRAVKSFRNWKDGSISLKHSEVPNLLLHKSAQRSSINSLLVLLRRQFFSDRLTHCCGHAFVPTGGHKALLRTDRPLRTPPQSMLSSRFLTPT